MSRIHRSRSTRSPYTGGTTATRSPEDGRRSLSLEWWPIERPIPYARNPRVVPEAAIEKVAASLKEYGFRQPIVVDTADVIVVGHARLLAAKRLGWAHVPVHVASDLTPQQVKAYRLADNRSAQESSWDLELLPLEISELADLGYDLDLLGFDAKELANLAFTAKAGLTDPDEVPEPPAEPVTRPGDLWILGEHRLLCDDSTKAENITKLMDGRRARLLASDPPYCIGYSGGSHPQGWAKRSPLRDKDWSADYQEGEVGSAAEFFASFISVALEQAVEEDAAFYLWHASLRQPDLFAAMRSCGLLVHQQIIWAKSRAVLTHSHYLWAHEGCLYGWSQGHMPKCRPPATATTVWEISSVIEDGAAGIHPTMKPVECFRRPILYHTSPGDVVYEPFCGSGTAIIAAEELGRVCYALELSPAFCDVSVARWERFTGKKAVRHG